MKTAIACALVLGVTGAASAQSTLPAGEAAGNLPSGFYVPPSCPSPDKTVIGKQPASTDRDETLAYNFRIRRFNKDVAAFNDCIKAYAEKADHDIERILSVINGAVAEAQGNTPPPLPMVSGNMPADFYPVSPCAKPNRELLGVQPPATDVKAMAGYNLRVAAFNGQAESFTACLKAYQDKARRDMEQIRVAVRSAAADMRAP
jgi:hypothetical protein